MDRHRLFRLIGCIAAVVIIAAVIAILGRNTLTAPEATVWTPAGKPAAAAQFSSEAEQKADELKMKVAAENASLAMLFREEDALIGILNKADGTVYYTTPVDAASDSIATSYYIRKLQSVLNVTYINEYAQSAEMDSYDYCVADGQFEAVDNGCGLDITYTMGATAAKLVLPQVISEERFLEYISKLPEKTQKKIIRNYTFFDKAAMKPAEYEENVETYPGLADHNIYVVKSGTKDYLREELAEYFIEAGYTTDDVIADLEANTGESTSDKPWFNITVSYCLDGADFIAEIKPSTITYNDDGYYLTNIDFLPYFGAADTEKSGYIFVPDGCGALINLNNGKVKESAYIAKVYGTDMTLNSLYRFKTDTDDRLSVKMPVYGIKADDTAWLAVIEDGEAYASITADISGRTTSYNFVYPKFSYLTYGSISLGDIVGANSFYMYSEKPQCDSYRLRFSFLSGDRANYSGMAESYRNYLKANGVLTGHADEEQLPFFAEYVGAIEKTTSTLGVKYEATTPLTTYEEAFDITDRLAKSGVGNIKVMYDGWQEDGIHSPAASGIKAEPKLGRRTDFSELVSGLKSLGADFYPMADMQRVYENTLTDGYSTLADAPRYFDRSVVKTYNYIYANGAMDDWDVNLISPYFAESLAGIISERVGKYGAAGLGISSISSNLYADYDSDKYTDRQLAKLCNEKAMAVLAKNFGDGILTTNSNVYALKYSKAVADIPTSSNRLRIIDEDVPFYQMVIKGSLSFAGKTLNTADDYRTELLRAAETGGGISFKWIAGNNSVIKDTKTMDLYSVNYLEWFNQAVEDWKHLNEECGETAGATILTHERLANGLVLTCFDNGVQIAVNYTASPVEYNGVTVGAMDFAKVHGIN